MSCRPLFSIEKAILAKLSAASNELVPSLLYWLLEPSYEWTCSRMLRDIGIGIDIGVDIDISGLLKTFDLRKVAIPRTSIVMVFGSADASAFLASRPNIAYVAC